MLFRQIFISVAALSMVATVASAAELSIDPDQKLQEYVPTQSASPWYLRGDVGYNFSANPKGGFSYSSFDPLTGSYSSAKFDAGSLGGGGTAGIGLGYRFTDYFRADATFDVLRMSFDGKTSSSQPCAPDPALIGTSCSTDESASATAYSIMANIYVDLGTYVGFTPYAGLGLGASYVNWGNLDSTAFCAGASCPAPGALPLTSHRDGAGDWRFAWAVMAGVAYDISPRLKADFGYRFRDIGGGGMFAFDNAMQAVGATGVQGRDHGMRSHEVRIGLRYALW